MEKGLNSDIVVSGQSFHVQTEDWGLENPYVVSRVYRSGAVLSSVKTPYSRILAKTTESSQQAIRTAIENQHKKILDQLLSGHLA